MLTRLAPGIMDSSDLHFARPADNSLGQNLTGNSPGGGGPLTSNNLVQPDRQAPYYTRWELSLQHAFGSGWVLATTYVGSRGRNLPVFHDVNNIPIRYLSTSRFRDTANETFLTTNVPNPFVGLLAGSTINNATVQRQQLLRPFPEFGTFGIEENTGSDQYTAGTLQIERRFRNGNSFTVQYTRSSLRDKLKYLNPADGILEDRTSPNDRPNRLSLGSSIVLPFGRSHRWGNEWGSALDAVLGGCRRADQRRRQPDRSAERPAHPDGQQRPLLPVDVAGRPHASVASAGRGLVEELLAAA